MSEKNFVSDHVTTLIKNIQTNELQKKVFVVAAVIELLRRAQLLDKRAATAIANFTSKVPDVAWEKLQFSFTQAVSTSCQKAAAQHVKESADADKLMLVLLKAITVFSDILADAPEEATAEVFDAVVNELIETHWNAPVIAGPAPTLFQPQNINKIFKAKPLDEKLCRSLGMRLVLYKTPHGPQIRGAAFGSDPQHIILETGEYLQLSQAEAGITSLTTPEDYTSVPAVLLAYVYLAFSHLENVGAVIDREGAVISGALGEFSADVKVVPFSVFAAKPPINFLQSIVDTPKTADSMVAHVTAATTARLPVPGTNMAVTLHADYGHAGGYIVSRLVDQQTDEVLLRNDQPRELAAQGIYLFPTHDTLIALRIF
jgi:hypothetical protein